MANSYAQNLSTDGGMLIAEHIEKQYKIIKNISNTFVDNRSQNHVTHNYYDMLKQQVYRVLQGYEDINDVEKLIKEIFDKKLASQPTISRFEK